jgi:hypothetical protein
LTGETEVLGENLPQRHLQSRQSYEKKFFVFSQISIRYGDFCFRRMPKIDVTMHVDV